MKEQKDNIGMMQKAWQARGIDPDFIDYYLEHRLAEAKVFALFEGESYKGLYLVDSKVLSLHDKNIKTAYIHPVVDDMTLFEEVLAWASQTHLVSLLPEVNERYQYYGFEMVVETNVYNISSLDLPEFSVKGINLEPDLNDCLKVYNQFTRYFSAAFVRTREDFKHHKALMKRRGGSILGLEIDQQLVGYLVYIRGSSFVDVLELCYDKSSTLLQMLSFITKGVGRARLHVSPAEHLNRILPHLKGHTSAFMSARINDKELFERLYHIKIISAYSGFNAFGKPIWNRDLM